MKKNRLFAQCAIFFLVFLGMLPVFQSAMADIIGPTQSNTCTWKIDDNYVLSIYPTNPNATECTMESWAASDASGNTGTIMKTYVPWCKVFGDNWENVKNITAFRIDEKYKVKTSTDASYMFAYFSSCTDWSGLKQIDVSGTTRLMYMFLSSSIGSGNSLSNISGWNVSNVTKLWGLFSTCSSLTDLRDISGWIVSSATDMSYMFANTGVTNLNGLSTWDVQRLKIFRVCFQIAAV